MLQSVSFDQLRMFVAAADEGSFSAAARHVLRTQSAVSEAILKMGFAQTRQVVFNSGVFEHFSKVELPSEMSHFWVRNIFTARLAERIAAAYGANTGSEYLAGLLHDFGAIVVVYTTI